MPIIVIFIILSLIYIFYDDISTIFINVIILLTYCVLFHCANYVSRNMSLGFYAIHLVAVSLHIIILLILFLIKRFDLKFIWSVIIVLMIGVISFILPLLFEDFYMPIFFP